MYHSMRHGGRSCFAYTPCALKPMFCVLEYSDNSDNCTNLGSITYDVNILGIAISNGLSIGNNARIFSLVTELDRTQYACAP